MVKIRKAVKKDLKDSLKGALSENVVGAVTKLRREQQVAATMVVFIASSKHTQNQYGKSITLQFDESTDNLWQIIQKMQVGLSQIYRPEIEYAKSGIMLLNLSLKKHQQMPLFSDQDPNKTVSDVMESINQKWKKKLVVPAITLWKNRPWKVRSDNRSPRYTTDLNEICKVKAA